MDRETPVVHVVFVVAVVVVVVFVVVVFVVVVVVVAAPHASTSVAAIESGSLQPPQPSDATCRTEERSQVGMCSRSSANDSG